MGTLTMRLRWYAWPSLLGLAAIAGVLVWGIFNRGVLGVGALLAVGWFYSKFAMKIEVTPADVGLTTWPVRRRQSASRDSIRAMRWYSRTLNFVDGDNRVLLKVGSLGWTGGQWLELSEALGVRLYNHRTKGGLGQDTLQGQVVQRTSDSSNQR